MLFFISSFFRFSNLTKHLANSSAQAGKALKNMDLIDWTSHIRHLACRVAFQRATLTAHRYNNRHSPAESADAFRDRNRPE